MFRRSVFGFVISFAIVLSGCSKTEAPLHVRLENNKALERPPLPVMNGEPIRIVVGSMITPKEGYAYYKKLLDYISKKIERPVKLVDREGYAAVNDLLKKRGVDVAFVCGQPYVEGHNDFGMEILAAPYAYGGTVYYSYIIVHKDSPIKSFEELRGKTFAFADPMSNTGKLVPTYMLSKMGETPETFFKKYSYTHAHDRSIKAVAQKIVDGAAVDSLIWEYANRVDPGFTAKTRIIAKSSPFGIPPVVVHPDMDPELKGKLRQIFLDVHNDPEGKKILAGMMIDKFVMIDDLAYDSIREMQKSIKGESTK